MKTSIVFLIAVLISFTGLQSKSKPDMELHRFFVKLQKAIDKNDTSTIRNCLLQPYFYAEEADRLANDTIVYTENQEFKIEIPFLRDLIDNSVGIETISIKEFCRVFSISTALITKNMKGVSLDDNLYELLFDLTCYRYFFIKTPDGVRLFAVISVLCE